jgi:hypothetical protein
MRTTLVLEDHVFRKAKQRAAELGTTLSEFTNRALRDAMDFSPQGKEKARPFVMPVYGPETTSPLSLARIKLLRDEGN